MRAFSDCSLYVIITGAYGRGRTALEIAERAIAGGAEIVQLREKDRTSAELRAIGGEIAALCKRTGTLFIVNDDPALARALDADGVHLGREDLARWPVAKARAAIGPGKLIGLSATTLDEVRSADAADVDYIGFGPVFPTAVKDGCAGIDAVPGVLSVTAKPVVFIGGIDLSNIDRILASGARTVAVIRGVIAADDIEAAARQYREKMRCRGGAKSKK